MLNAQKYRYIFVYFAMLTIQVYTGMLISDTETKQAHLDNRISVETPSRGRSAHTAHQGDGGGVETPVRRKKPLA